MDLERRRSPSFLGEGTILRGRGRKGHLCIYNHAADMFDNSRDCVKKCSNIKKTGAGHAEGAFELCLTCGRDKMTLPSWVVTYPRWCVGWAEEGFGCRG